MQSGANPDLFATFDCLPPTQPTTTMPNIPVGSRLAQYLHGANNIITKQSSWTGPLPNRPVTSSYNPLVAQNMPVSNVANFIPSFAQLNMNDDKDMGQVLSVPQYMAASQRPMSYHGNSGNAMMPRTSVIGGEALRPNSVVDQLRSNSVGETPENFGGTVYYFQSTSDASPDQRLEPQNDCPILVPNHCGFAYQGPIPHIGKYKIKNPSFFVSPDLKMELLQRQLAIQSRIDPNLCSNVPSNIDHFHHIVPLENIKYSASHLPAFITTVYKAISLRDGMPYCLRRIHNFRQTSAKQLSFADCWKKLVNVNVVQLRDVFVTRHFGDNSLIFVYDFHPLSDTLRSRHFTNRVNGSSAQYTEGSSKPSQPNSGAVQESLLWTYIVQLSSALRAIHGCGMAARSVDLTKIIVFSKSKVLLSGCGIFDVLAPEPNPNAIQNNQQEDLNGLGRVLLALATGNLQATRRDSIPSNCMHVLQSFSADMRNLISHLLGSPLQQGIRLRSINDIMPMIGARFYAQLEVAQMKVDLLENELSKELENGRLFRLMCKLNTVLERAEFRMNVDWSETGDRYLLKLFRDYLFHQVSEAGKPWIDVSHIVTCLNKLDAGVSEKIQLVSRDGENVLIVSYNDLRNCVSHAFGELEADAGQNNVPRIPANLQVGRR